VNTILERFDGVSLIRPLGDFRWPHPTFDGFPKCCGAGKGIGNDIVPETILGLNVSPACCVHDYMQDRAPRTWGGFHYSNAVFLVNLLEINRVKSNWFMQKCRIPIIIGWFAAVSSVAGSKIFFKTR
jgi:hypothetical protein